MVHLSCLKSWHLNLILPSEDTLQGLLIVPSTALEGATRLRVMMSRDSSLLPCSSPELGEVEDFCVNVQAPVAIESLEVLPRVIVYPNPTNGEIQVECTEMIRKVELFSLQGQKVYESHEINRKEQTFSLEALPEGLFLIRVQTDKGIWLKKVVRQ